MCKAIDKWVEEKIEEVRPFKAPRLYINDNTYSQDNQELQLELLTTAVNKLIQIHNK